MRVWTPPTPALHVQPSRPETELHRRQQTPSASGQTAPPSRAWEGFHSVLRFVIVTVFPFVLRVLLGRQSISSVLPRGGIEAVSSCKIKAFLSRAPGT